MRFGSTFVRCLLLFLLVGLLPGFTHAQAASSVVTIDGLGKGTLDLSVSWRFPIGDKGDGVCTLASAGHPAPYLNFEEITLPGALSLGIDPAILYEETTLRLHPGDRCSLNTDGLLGRRTLSGEIFSFERLRALFASNADTTQASEAALAFSQEDDLTVVTLTLQANA